MKKKQETFERIPVNAAGRNMPNSDLWGTLTHVGPIPSKEQFVCHYCGHEYATYSTAFAKEHDDEGGGCTISTPLLCSDCVDIFLPEPNKEDIEAAIDTLVDDLIDLEHL